MIHWHGILHIYSAIYIYTLMQYTVMHLGLELMLQNKIILIEAVMHGDKTRAKTQCFRDIG